jgi:hypothetical protein
MSTRRYKVSRKNKKINNKNKTGKKWTTAIAAANKTLQKTGSFSAAKASLKKQALYNARKLFGSI